LELCLFLCFCPTPKFPPHGGFSLPSLQQCDQ
jgi:hypothetical protein